MTKARVLGFVYAEGERVTDLNPIKSYICRAKVVRDNEGQYDLVLAILFHTKDIAESLYVEITRKVITHGQTQP